VNALHRESVRLGNAKAVTHDFTKKATTSYPTKELHLRWQVHLKMKFYLLRYMYMKKEITDYRKSKEADILICVLRHDTVCFKFFENIACMNQSKEVKSCITASL
jgi:hypothetical protein